MARAEPKYQFERLSYENLDEFLELQETALKLLKRGSERRYLYELTKAELTGHLDAGMDIIALRDQSTGNIAAQGLMTEMGTASTYLDQENFPEPHENKTAIIHGFMMDPKHLRHDMYTKLFEAFMCAACDDGYDQVYVRTAADNARVITGLMRQGFNKIAEMHNPLIGNDVIFLSRKTSPNP